MGKELAVQTPVSIDWAVVMDALGDSEDILLKIKAVGRIACGVPTAKIAKEIGVPRATVEGWKNGQAFQNALTFVRGNLSEYIRADLDSVRIKASEFINEVLEKDVDAIGDAKERQAYIREKGLMARFVHQQFEPEDEKAKSTIAVFNIDSSAAKMLADRLNPQVKVINVEESD